MTSARKSTSPCTSSVSSISADATLHKSFTWAPNPDSKIDRSDSRFHHSLLSHGDSSLVVTVSTNSSQQRATTKVFVSVLEAEMQRCLPPPVLRIEVRSSPQQDLAHLLGPRLCCNDNERVPKLISSLRVNTCGRGIGSERNAR